MMLPLVSIIIPVYNVEYYLRECLNSVILQTYNNLEIICVDDGSTDNSGVVAEEYASLDNRITVYHKKNGGLSSARNVGLQVCRGKFIMFLDSDDMISDDAIEKIVLKFAETNADILVFGAELFPYSGTEHEKIVERYLTTPNKMYVGKEIYEKALFCEESCNIFVWNKVFKAEMLRGDSFDETILLGEDRCFLFDVIPKACILVLTDEKLYKYRQKRETSLTGSFVKKDFERTKWKLRLLNHIYNDWFNKKQYISVKAREQLVSWSRNYIVRSIQNLDEEQAMEIYADFHAILDFYFV